jgi:WD40 repeat protein
MHWNLLTCKLIKKRKMGSAVRHIDIDGTGKMLAVGHRNGSVAVLDPASFDQIAILKKFKNPDKEVCSLVKFSPNSTVLAVGYCPPISKVYIYDCSNFKSVKICKGSPSRIHQLDFSTSSC